jgi:hypothetical protein
MNKTDMVILEKVFNDVSVGQGKGVQLVLWLHTL